MRREGRCHVRRQDSSDPGTVTTPTTTADTTNKIKPSLATELTSTDLIVGARNDGQHHAGALTDASESTDRGPFSVVPSDAGQRDTTDIQRMTSAPVTDAIVMQLNRRPRVNRRPCANGTGPRQQALLSRIDWLSAGSVNPGSRAGRVIVSPDPTLLGGCRRGRRRSDGPRPTDTFARGSPPALARALVRQANGPRRFDAADLSHRSGRRRGT